MPRLSSSLLRYARHVHPLLPPLLRMCRDLTSARNELRWLLEHAISLSNDIDSKSARYGYRPQLRQLVRQRERGKPLQYILGSQPFGDLDILCRAGVLIPRSAACIIPRPLHGLRSSTWSRPETESLTAHLATLLPTAIYSRELSLQRLRILDVCTGTGCIPLLLHSLLGCRLSDARCCGVDISVKAKTLARQNLQHNIRLGHLGPSAQKQICFVQDDIFEDSAKEWRNSTWDIVISNPPYISPDGFKKTTSRSVRNFEPRTALVPQHDQNTTATPTLDHELGDMFYPRLLHIAHQVGSQVLLMEVADMLQARRVADMVIRSGTWSGCEIWRDWPGQGENRRNEMVEVAEREVRVRGEGHGRAVLAWRNGGGKLPGKK